VATKRLSSVDLPHLGSNQHEIGGVKALRTLLGTNELTRRQVEWIGLRAGGVPVRAEGSVTFSDVRRNNPNRAAEWHLYYTGSFLEQFSPGDPIWFALMHDELLVIVVADAGSEWEAGCAELFGLVPEGSGGAFRDGGPELEAGMLSFAATQVADALELDVPVTGDAAAIAREYFPDGFPTTRRLSEVARETAPGAPTTPDEQLQAWFRHETEIFAAVERSVVAERIASGFVHADVADVEGFLQFSLSVQNRRKSRAGAAFENHLAEVFTRAGLRFERQATTELRSRPDFLFPGAAAYHDTAFPANRLRMLGAKTTCKERWGQVLKEAARIPAKHLCTMQEGVSAAQLREMEANELTLVVPAGLHALYPAPERDNVLTVAAFVDEVTALQH
jgi:hypothetical protein